MPALLQVHSRSGSGEAGLAAPQAAPVALPPPVTHDAFTHGRHEADAVGALPPPPQFALPWPFFSPPAPVPVAAPAQEGGSVGQAHAFSTAQQGGEGARAANDSMSPAGARAALQFVLSREGAPFRAVLLDEIVKSIDALSRDQLFALVHRLGLGALRVPLPVLGAGARSVPLAPPLTPEDRAQVDAVAKLMEFLSGALSRRHLHRPDAFVAAAPETGAAPRSKRQTFEFAAAQAARCGPCSTRKHATYCRCYRRCTPSRLPGELWQAACLRLCPRAAGFMVNGHWRQRPPPARRYSAIQRAHAGGCRDLAVRHLAPRQPCHRAPAATALPLGPALPVDDAACAGDEATRVFFRSC